MKIQDKDIYHGAVLTQIVEHSSFTALNKADGKYGHYIVNHDIHLFVKVAKESMKGLTKEDEKQTWQFTFNESDLQSIRNEITPNKKLFMCLVCGQNTICVLNVEQLKQIINITSEESQWVKVEYASGERIQVRGSMKDLDKKFLTIRSRISCLSNLRSSAPLEPKPDFAVCFSISGRL